MVSRIPRIYTETWRNYHWTLYGQTARLEDVRPQLQKLLLKYGECFR